MKMTFFQSKHARAASRVIAGTALVALVPALLAACGKADAPAEPFIPSTQVMATETPPPDYPFEVACAGIGGTTVLTVTVGVEGKPTEVVLAQSSGNRDLDRAFGEVRSILAAERLKRERQPGLSAFVRRLRAEL